MLKANPLELDATHEEQSYFAVLPFPVSFVPNENREGVKMDQLKDELLSKLANGSKTAFTEIYNEYNLYLLNFARSFIESPDTCKDILMDLWTRVWENRERFSDIDNLKSFLFTAVRNGCIDHLRRAATRTTKYVEYIDQLQEMVRPEELIDTRFELRLLLKEIENLPPQSKLVFELFYLQGLSLDEISEKLKKPKATVKSIKAKLLRQMRWQRLLEKSKE